MQKSTEKIIRQKLNKLRANPRVRLSQNTDISLLTRIYDELGEKEFNRILKQEGEVDLLTDRFGVNIPSFLYDFIDDLIIGINQESPFDPWVTPQTTQKLRKK
ncbi:MAG: hypothetical protein GVY26_19220 [Bacteroidetes bacterium]|jgi:hypothetical protein|nr:hypothetical protein [Bacteroidota bacterium]